MTRRVASREPNDEVARSVALLRAVNVGGRTVTMAGLVKIVQGLGLERVETFLASGNIVFWTPAMPRRDLERRLETALGTALGYGVPVFVRTLDEISAISRYEAFAPERVAEALAYNVAFLSSPLEASGIARIRELTTDIDAFHVHGTEVYWLCRLRQSQSRFNNNVLERALGRRATIRGMSTIRRLVDRYRPA
jgi:uncharacterized protein (DUF1697 family)